MPRILGRPHSRATTGIWFKMRMVVLPYFILVVALLFDAVATLLLLAAASTRE